MKLTFKLAQLHGGWNSDDNQTNNLGRFRFSVTPSATATANPLPHAVRTILEIPSGQRTESQVRHLFSYWRSVNPHWSDANRRIDALWQSHPQGATQLALIERDGLRPTHRLERGNFLKPAEEVTPGVPSFLHPFPADQPVNRLTLAKWLVDRRSPTTARALVNRVWQAYFGRGLVATSEDLGTQSAYPTHPGLLDWLAVDFMEHGWSLKHLHQVIVASAAYQQQSEISPALLERDPENVELARGPRFRADAEAVYDIALSVSGLLSARIGGPSVFPPAPSFLFQPPASYGPKTWNEEEGSNRYRRAMYTFRFRSVPHPALTNFDAPNGETACVRRVRTNSPLQALTTLNEPLFMECACAFGRRIVREGGESDSERLAFAHQTCTARPPTAEELSILEKFLEQQREHFANSAVEAQRLIQGSDRSLIGSITPEAMSEIAAWTVVGRVLLNLDETVTKE